MSRMHHLHPHHFGQVQDIMLPQMFSSTIKEIICDVINQHLIQNMQNSWARSSHILHIIIYLIAIHNGMPSNGLDEHPQQSVR